MKGKIPEIAVSHVSCRVLQTCAKYCTQDERNVVYEELKPHFLTLACNTYAVHLITKLLDNALKEQLADLISSLRGHVDSLLRHMVGSVVVEHAYQLGNPSPKQSDSKSSKKWSNKLKWSWVESHFNCIFIAFNLLH